MFKDYSLIVKCNDGPSIRMSVVARSYERAIEYAKSAYTAQYTTYADNRYNTWVIKESK